LSVVAVAALAVAVGITWFKTPDKPEPASSVLVVKRSGPPVCGALQASPAGTIEILEKDTRDPETVAVGEVVAMTAVAACPGED
jgi:hypothetical protein